MRGLLIACVGNIFQGDDAFGVEVARRLSERELPAGVDVVDFGIQGIDLMYALLEQCDTAILVDAIQQGSAPGTVHLIEAEMATVTDITSDGLSPRSLNPNLVLRAVTAVNGRCRRVLVVGCEPAELGDEFDGRMGLSPPVAAAVDEAVVLIEELTKALLEHPTEEQRYLVH